MVLGCTSDAGKSLLVTALCRWFARSGVDVVPFKGQNMSNNARVVAGGEIGVAQWLQAKAAGVEPTVAMNPVLVKPEADTRSQVVVAGRARPELSALPWEDRPPLLWEAMRHAYDSLADRHELVIIEGAGSPAETNLVDLVNNAVLDHADAAALLVADIDRGGAFAHLFGTWSLVPTSTRDRLAGFVLNKFRGDAALLHPAPGELSARTGMADLGVLPMLAHELPDEEGATVRATPPSGAPAVAVIRYPYGSNLDEWHLLAHAAHVRWATAPRHLHGADLVVLPGSKHVAADRAWLAETGLDDEVVATAHAGTRVLGVCGGAMLLGGPIVDPHRREGAAVGLGLLPLVTELQATKRTSLVEATFPTVDGPWAPLSAQRAAGYEIRYGEVSVDPSPSATPVAERPGIWAAGSVLATAVHGLFEDPTVIGAVTGSVPRPVLDETIDALADAVDAHLDTEALRRLVGSPG